MDGVGRGRGRAAGTGTGRAMRVVLSAYCTRCRCDAMRCDAMRRDEVFVGDYRTPQSSRSLAKVGFAPFLLFPAPFHDHEADWLRARSDGGVYPVDDASGRRGREEGGGRHVKTCPTTPQRTAYGSDLSQNTSAAQHSLCQVPPESSIRCRQCSPKPLDLGFSTSR